MSLPRIFLHPRIVILLIALAYVALGIGMVNLLTFDIRSDKTVAPPTKTTFSTPYTGVDHKIIDYRAWQLPVLRVTSRKACITSIHINHRKIVLGNSGGYRLCRKDWNGDIGKYIEPGENRLVVRYSEIKNGHYNPRSMKGSYPSWLMPTLILLMLATMWLALPKRFTRTKQTIAALKSLFHSYPLWFWAGAIAVIAVAIDWRIHYLPHISGDMYSQLQNWINYIRLRGVEKAFRYNFSNYTLLYNYLLAAADILFPSIHRIVLVKIVTFAGEIVACVYAFRLIALAYPLPSMRPWIAALALFAAPTVIVNGAAVGQCDIWYTGLLIATVFYLIKERPSMAMVMFGLSFALKAQALFLAPFLLAAILAFRMSWVHLLIVPLIYIATLVPAWLEGRSFLEMLFIYHQQFFTYNKLYMGLANIYKYIPNAYYNELRLAGSIFTTFLGLAYALWVSKTLRKNFSVYTVLLTASLCLAIIPFFAPKMIDRYFFGADIFTLLLAVAAPRLILLTILFQASTILSYPGFQFYQSDQFLKKMPFRRYDLTLMTSLALVMLTWLHDKHQTYLFSGKKKSD